MGRVISVEVSAAYRHCAEVTRGRARNFWYGIRLLPGPKRRALSALYAFARLVDDITDGNAPADVKQKMLTDLRERLHAVDGGAAGDDAVFVALADVAASFPVTLRVFDELLDGCEDDVRGVEYRTFADLERYCRCIAGSTGRLLIGVFGTDDPHAAEPFADAVGIALQLTNVLRDIAEDSRNGRIYLPAEDLDRFGCTLRWDGQRLTDPPEALVELVRFEAERAQRWYDEGLRLLPHLDRRSAACVAAMATIYRRLLDRVAADPLAALSRRTSLPTREKAVVVARALVHQVSS
ncbi:presqualene diphosphate synthase HpnD [Lentzea sp. NPDC051213]|uniref:presqualene diphosphate synthase HpnD n=1 Tax=Lentzea sp. NPDC051213 TaxID=3364126 RepID=UPI0037A8E335